MDAIVVLWRSRPFLAGDGGGISTSVIRVRLDFMASQGGPAWACTHAIYFIDVTLSRAAGIEDQWPPSRRSRMMVSEAFALERERLERPARLRRVGRSR